MDEYCDFLQGVCILQTALAEHVMHNNFYNPELVELANNTGGIKVIPYDAQADETARALIHVQRDAISLGSMGNLTQNALNSTFAPKINLHIQISTQSYYFTEKLGQEVLQYIASIQGALRNFNFNIGSINLSPTMNNKESSPNYFVNTVNISGSIPITMWKTKTSNDILSCIKTNITFNEQKILS